MYVKIHVITIDEKNNRIPYPSTEVHLFRQKTKLQRGSQAPVAHLHQLQYQRTEIQDDPSLKYLVERLWIRGTRQVAYCKTFAGFRTNQKRRMTTIKPYFRSLHQPMLE